MPARDNPHAAVAILAGISDYQRTDRIAPLRFAHRDARSLARLLTDPRAGNFSPDHAQVLTNRQAPRADLVKLFSDWLPTHAQGAEVVLVYFAGHGTVQPAGERDEGYLLPCDADPDDLARTAIAMSDLAAWLARVEAGAIVLCLDCCHAGKVLSRDSSSADCRPRDMSLPPLLLQGISGKGRFLIASCDEGQKSLECADLRHGLFTYHLLRGLRGAADRDGDGRISVSELFNYVSTSVARDAKEKYGWEQKPWTSATWTEEVILSRARAETQAAGGDATFDQLWRQKGAAPTITLIEKEMAGASESRLLELLRFLRRKGDLTALPAIFRCLLHASEPVRLQARKALLAGGWERAASGVEELARRGQPEQIVSILDGLAALEAHPNVVVLLEKLTGLLRADLRQRADALAERKRLGVELERLENLFRTLRVPYRLERVLGSGLFTATYLARDEVSGLEVVVRVPRPAVAAQPLLRGQLRELCGQAVRFVHQNLALTRFVHDLDDPAVPFFIVRDHIDGATLRHLLESGRTLNPLAIVEVLRQVVDALAPLHRAGVAHGGIKPSNIYLCRDDRVILGEPALPATAAPGHLVRLGYDYRYLAPELLRGENGPPADFYALGCVAYELFCGRPPFLSEQPHELAAMHQRDNRAPIQHSVPELAVWLNPFLDRLLARTPQGRVADCKELRQQLDGMSTAIEFCRPKPGHESSPPPATSLPGVSFEQFAPPRPAGGPASPLLPDASLDRLAGQQSLLSLGAGPSPSETLPPGPVEEEPSGARSLPQVPGFEILGELGRGGMGVVYQARQVALKRIVSLKMILAGSHAGEAELARFRTEAEAVARLQHPHIVQVFEVGEHQGFPYLSLEFCAGGSLAKRLQGAPLPPAEAAALVEKLARAMQAAHAASVIHRDLKPANVLLLEDGTPKITDFGLAKKLDDAAGQTQTGAIMGTPSYMAPEQAQGRSKDIGTAADIYALGAMLYECMTGRPPFRAATVMDTLMQVIAEEPVPPSQLQPKVPCDLETICLKCLEKDPARRYESASSLADDLAHFLQGEPIRARAVGRMERSWRWCRRNPAVAALLAVSALAALAGSLWFVLRP
jgi:serine/threonine protein kinase